MEMLMGFGAVLIFITLVGHGMWVFLAWLIKGLDGLVSAPGNRPLPAEMCPRCGAVWERRRGVRGCGLCNWPRPVASGRPSLNPGPLLMPLRRRVERYHQLGLISTEVRDRLLQGFPSECAPELEPELEPALAAAAAGPLRADMPAEVVLTPRTPPPARRARPAAVGPAPAVMPVTPPPAAPAPAPAPALSPAEPAQRVLGFLAAFLEEKNIRWGEIVGGLLIVGCSLALVISFWSSIAERPLLKYGLFTGITALLFGLGLHAERRWRLPTTALGLLMIATLLIPLNFLAVASLGRGAVAASAWGVAGEVASVALFGWLTYLAGRSLVTQVPWALTPSVLVPSAAMLLVRRYAGPHCGLLALLTLGGAPLVAQAAPVGVLIVRIRHRLRRTPDAELDESDALDLLRLLGLSTFAVALGLGLLIGQGGLIGPTLHRAAPLAPLAGAPALAMGLLLWRRTTAAELVGYRTAGTAIAAAGVFVMLAGVALAWPDPAGMIPVALLNFTVLLVLALGFALPAAHVLAGVCLTVAYLLGWLVLTGALGWSVATSAQAVSAIFSAHSGAALTPLVLFFGAATALGLRLGRRHDAQAYALVAAMAWAFSLGLVTWYGFGRNGDPAGAAWVYAIDAVAALAAASWFGRYPLVERTDGKTETQVLGWLGSGLLLACFLQGMVYGLVLSRPLEWFVAFLLHAQVTAIVAALLASRPAKPSTPRSILGDLLSRSALATSAAALGAWFIAVPETRTAVLAAHLLWLALVGLILAWRFASPGLFALVQAALAGSLVLTTTTVLQQFEWYAVSPHPWLDPRTIQAHAIVLGVFCLAWIGLRLMVRVLRAPVWDTARVLLEPPWPPFDRVLRGGLFLVLAALALYGVFPGTLQELTSGDIAAQLAPDYAMTVSVRIDHFPVAILEPAGIPHEHALGVGSQVLVCLVVCLLLAGQWERFRRRDLIAALVAGALSVPLVAGHWTADLAAATALRWGSALYLAAASGLIWDRGWLARCALRLGWIDVSKSHEAAGLKRMATGTVLGLGLVPLAVITGFAGGAALAGLPLAGPLPQSFFGRMGPAASYAVPLVLAAATLLGHAFRERSAAFALAAALTLNAAATAAYLLAGGRVPLTVDAALFARLALLNAIVASASALAWTGFRFARQRRAEPDAPEPASPLMTTLLDLSLGLLFLVLLAGTWALYFVPLPGAFHAVIAGPWGWAAVLLAAGAVAAWARQARSTIGPDGFGLGVLASACFLALALAARDAGDWRTFHGFMAGQGLAGAVLMLAVWQRGGFALGAVPASVRSAVVRWSGVGLALAVLFALRALNGDPQAPWWTVGGLAGLAPLAMALAVWSGRGSLLGLAALLLNTAVTCWAWWQPTQGTATDLMNLNILTLALPAPLWLWVDRRLIRAGNVERVPFQRVAAWLALGLLGLVVALGLTADAMQAGTHPKILLGWAALAAAAIAMAAGLWDGQSRASVAGLYLLGLCGSGWGMHQLHLSPRWLVWTGTVVLSAYALATSYLWSRRALLRGLANRLRMPPPDVADPVAGLWWLAPANVSLITLVFVLAFGTILTEPEALLRALAAHAALAEVLAAGLLARGERRLRLQLFALGAGVLGAVAWGWAWIAPDAPFGLLDRLVTLLVVLASVTALYGLGLVKLLRRETEWSRAAVRLVPGLLGLGGVVLAVVIGVEISQRVYDGRIAMSGPAVLGVALALLGTGAVALVAAVVPGRDPLGLSERGRTAYVYGCEVLLAVLVLHLRLTMPWLFLGFFARYRPLIIVGVAYLGVGLSELCRRQGRLVLAEPLERTGALLPALPLLGAYWIEIRPGLDIVFLVLAGGLYTALSLLRSSLGFGALATLAYNAALWVLLGRREGLGLFQHPQLWIIPPAFCVLIGAYLNRDRLSESQTTSIRYAASLAIYLSSTADIMLIGVAQAPWLPLVLAALSLVGIFAGIALRVRGFFLLGLGFLGLSLLTIIWHAAVDLRQTWLWSASGIAAGFLILGLFAVFEKKQQDVLRMVDEFKQWSS